MRVVTEQGFLYLLEQMLANLPGLGARRTSRSNWSLNLAVIVNR